MDRSGNKSTNAAPASTAEKRARFDETSGMATRPLRANVTPQADAGPARGAEADEDEPMDGEPDEKPAAVAVGGGRGDEDADDDEEDAEMEEAVDPKLAEFLDRKTLPFPAEVPLQYPFPYDTLYVRECYADYYDHIMTRFQNNRKRGVTVTGTPGIGKSVFMAYFFLRYKLEHSKRTIILASFDVDSGIDQVVVWKDDHAERSSVFDIRLLAMQYEEDPDAIFLLDGPPDFAPKSLRYVVFTSPNEGWFRKTWKDFTHTRLFLPLWDAEELMDAVDALHLHASLGRFNVGEFPRRDDGRHIQEVVYLYDVFGGVARTCLQYDYEFLTSQLRELKLAAATVDIASSTAMLKGDELKNMRHRLYHYVPSDDLMWWSLKLASPYVTQLLCERLEELTDREKEHFKSAITRSPEAAALYGSMQENAFHKVLEKGPQLVARQLVGNGEAPLGPLDLKILASTPVGLFKNKFKKSDLVGGPYFRPEGKTFESIDAFYLIELKDNKANAPWGDVEVVLFQVTVSETHPVKAKGLHTVLKQLGIKQDAVAQKAALVFAVPKHKADDFKRQDIAATVPLDPSSPMTMVNGIKVDIPAELKGTNIRTVGDLRSPPPDAKLEEEQLKTYKKAQKLLRGHENKAVAWGSDAHRVLEQIPQFVWGV